MSIFWKITLAMQIEGWYNYFTLRWLLRLRVGLRARSFICADPRKGRLPLKWRAGRAASRGKASLLDCADSRGEYKGDIMSRRETYEEKTEQLLSPIVEQYGVEIYDVEYVKEGKDYYLRAYIDKPEGVNIQDCENVSRALSDVLDEEDFIPDAYILEVSSPGLGRILKKDRHLEKSLGEAVELKTYKPIDKQKEFAGVLKAYDKQSIIIEEDGAERTFARADIATVRLALDI